MHRSRVEIKYLSFFCFLIFTIPRVVDSVDEGKVFQFNEPKSCDSSKNEYFHTESFECKKCANDSTLSDDGYSCVCDGKSKVVAVKEGNPICASCEVGKIRTRDGYECISCKEHGSCGCSENEITIERGWNGTLLVAQQCLPCPKNTYSTFEHSQCLPCFAVWSNSDRENWPLDHPSHDSLTKYCMPSNALKDWPDLQSTYMVKFQKKNINVDSYLFRKELKFTYYSCENGIRKACTQLANMCFLTLVTSDSTACKLFFTKTDSGNRSKLFYRDGEAKSVLSRRTITQRYTLDQKNSTSNRLKLVVATYGLRGHFDSVKEPNLPCPFFNDLPFGVNLLKRCKIPAVQLVSAEMSFLAPYLSFFDDNNAKVRLLHPVPILVRNINENFDEHDQARWKLVRRFFTIDKVTGYRAISNLKNSSFLKEPKLRIFRYLKSLSLVVKLQERSERGKIFPPLIILEYDELTYREIIENVETLIEYRVTYSFSEDDANITIEKSSASVYSPIFMIFFGVIGAIIVTANVFIGVLTGLAIAIAVVQAWSHSRRSGKNVASIATATWFVVYCFGAVGNVLLLVCSCSSVYTFVFYKGQKLVHTLLPDPANEWTISVCTVLAFAFKVVEILGLIYQQRRINIFFIDWEQPRTILAVPPSIKLESPRASLSKYKSRSSNERKLSVKTASEIIGARRKKMISSPTRSVGRESTSSSRESIENEIDNRSITKTIDHSLAGQTIATVSSEMDFSIDDENSGEEKNYSVSIWRTCVVANEWLRIKTRRKINILLQILATSFMLEIAGGKYLSKAIPEFTLEVDEMLHVDESFTLKYAIGILVYLIIYSTQWWFSVFIYQRYMKNELQEFVDLCSMSNISVFILSHDYYGYYIHGRSVHGFADTDLLTLIKDLKREENNLCAHRGLIPGTTEQTFVISVSKTFRTFYDRLLGIQNSHTSKFLRNISNSPANWDERWKTHLRLRKFLTGFLDHSYKNVDYTIKERHCLEKMCDLEITDVEEKSIFYIDSTYSFGQTIFHGNERTLATFEINVFLLMIVLGGNYIVALFAALLAAKAVSAIVKFNGKRLLAEKTFIDERFLVSQ